MCNKFNPNIDIILDKSLKERENYKKIKMIDYGKYPMKRRMILNLIHLHQIVLLLYMRLFMK